jgi:hypothetical protein
VSLLVVRLVVQATVIDGVANMAMPRTAWLLCVLLAALLLVCPGSGGRVRAGTQQAEAEALLDFVMHVEDSQQPDDDDFSLEQQDVMQDAMDVALLEQSAQEEIVSGASGDERASDQDAAKAAHLPVCRCYLCVLFSLLLL